MGYLQDITSKIQGGFYGDTLCPPARIYLIFSIIMFLVMVFQNYGQIDIYCLGKLRCEAPNLSMIFIIKILYTIFWTVIIQLLCNAKQPLLAWALVIYPLLLYVVLTLELFLQ